MDTALALSEDATWKRPFLSSASRGEKDGRSAGSAQARSPVLEMDATEGKGAQQRFGWSVDWALQGTDDGAGNHPCRPEPSSSFAFRMA
jgi:hypothetical protein